MKHFNSCPPPCGGPPPRPLPPCDCGRPCPPCQLPCPPPCPPERPRPQGNYLLQRILGCGKLHRRRQCYTLCLREPPCNTQPPWTVVDAAVCGAPAWEEIPCHERGVILLQVTVPLSLRARDCAGCGFIAQASIQEQVRLRLSCPEAECWRGQIVVQAAARLCGNACVCREPGCFEAALEVIVEGYVIAPCAVGAPCPPPCPEPRSWYPQPQFDPYRD